MRVLVSNTALQIGIFLIGLASLGYTCSFVLLPPTEVDPLLSVFAGSVTEHHGCHGENQDLVFLTIKVTEVISNAEKSAEYRVLPLMVAPDCSDRCYSPELLATRYPIGSKVWVIGRPLDLSPYSSTCLNDDFFFLEASPQDGCFVRRVVDSLSARRTDTLDVSSWELELDQAHSTLLVATQIVEANWRYEDIADFRYFDAHRELVNLKSAQTPQEVDSVINRLKVHPLYRDLPAVLSTIRAGARSDDSE